MSCFWRLTLIVSILGNSASVCAEQSKPTCESWPPYLVIIRQKEDSVYSDVIVKHSPQVGACSFDFSEGDIELPNVNVNGFILVARHYLFVGSTTAPGGGTFAAYDLEDGRKAVETDYLGEEIEVDADTVSFWKSLGIATRDECADYDRIESFGLVPTLVVKTRIRIDDLALGTLPKMTQTSVKRCMEQQ